MASKSRTRTTRLRSSTWRRCERSIRVRRGRKREPVSRRRERLETRDRASRSSRKPRETSRVCEARRYRIAGCTAVACTSASSRRDDTASPTIYTARDRRAPECVASAAPCERASRSRIRGGSRRVQHIRCGDESRSERERELRRMRTEYDASTPTRCVAPPRSTSRVAFVDAVGTDCAYALAKPRSGVRAG